MHRTPNIDSAVIICSLFNDVDGSSDYRTLALGDTMFNER
jgi:hypothetical protein